MNFKLSFLSVLLIVSFYTLPGQSFSEKRTFSKTVHVNKDMSLEVNNKYGTIHITTWDSDSASIRAEVEAIASNQSRLGKMLEGININISESSYMVIAKTSFTQSINMFFESFKGMTNKLIPYDSRIQINYYVSVPEYLDLKIVNKYGDVYMETNTGEFSINLSNGSFKANVIRKANDIRLAFCDATINKIGDGNIDATFSELVIGEAGDLNINSISSRFDLKKIINLRTESKKDKFFIGEVESVSGSSYFSDYKIDKLKKEVNITAKYGSFSADMVEKEIELITLNTNYSDISLIFDPAVSYNLDIRHINAFLTLPLKNSAIEKKSVNEEKKEYISFGTVGKNPDNVKVKIDATRGNIFIK